MLVVVLVLLSLLLILLLLFPGARLDASVARRLHGWASGEIFKGAHRIPWTGAPHSAAQPVRAWQDCITGNLRMPGRCCVKQAAMPATPVWALLAVWAVEMQPPAKGQGARARRESEREREGEGRLDGWTAGWEGLGGRNLTAERRASAMSHLADQHAG